MPPLEGPGVVHGRGPVVPSEEHEPPASREDGVVRQGGTGPRGRGRPHRGREVLPSTPSKHPRIVQQGGGSLETAEEHHLTRAAVVRQRGVPARRGAHAADRGPGPVSIGPRGTCGAVEEHYVPIQGVIGQGIGAARLRGEGETGGKVGPYSPFERPGVVQVSGDLGTASRQENVSVPRIVGHTGTRTRGRARDSCEIRPPPRTRRDGGVRVNIEDDRVGNSRRGRGRQGCRGEEQEQGHSRRPRYGIHGAFLGSSRRGHHQAMTLATRRALTPAKRRYA